MVFFLKIKQAHFGYVPLNVSGYGNETRTLLTTLFLHTHETTVDKLCKIINSFRVRI